MHPQCEVPSMQCPVCQTVNPENAKFCFNCGAALSSLCPNCRAQATPGAKFCLNCGFALKGSEPAPAQTINPVDRHMPGQLRSKIEAARGKAGAEGERRVVTILFCDVQGSTALAERFDPEEWAELMNGAFERLISPVYRYEGTVARLMGDAILAFFGAPIAHEDDPRRAVLAGLDIIEGIQTYRRQLPDDVAVAFNVRVGINTGLVVVGQVGSDLAGEYTAMGDAVNLAARMEQTAAPGTVQIAANTHRLVRELFSFEPLGGIDVKGKAEPVEAYRVLAIREGAVPTRGIEGLYSPIIGRDREITQLRGVIDGLLTGRGAIASLTGEAGLGKSRLVAELRRSLLDTGTLAPTGALRWLEGRSFSYETSVPYAPFSGMFRRFFDLDGLPGDLARYDRIRSRVIEIAPDRVLTIAPYVASLLGVAAPGSDGEMVRHQEPPMLRARVFQAVIELIGALAASGPVVLVLEDLHWADQTSLDLLAQLMPLVDSAPVVLLALFRPHRDEPSWRFHETAVRDWPHRYTEIPLQPLDDGDSRALVANLLEIEDLPERVRALILQKAEGNPFYVEEVIRSLLDMGLVVREEGRWRATREIETLRVPDTLAGVITARLDRAPEESRRVAQAASVIGREFQQTVLADVYEDPVGLTGVLGDLQRRELVLERQRLPEYLYGFKHVLTQETAYSSILLSKRRELHRCAAECLERREPDRVEEIARHYLEAREDVRALPYVVEAGDRARRAYAAESAINWYRRALTIIPMVEDSDPARRAFEGLGKMLELTFDVPGAVENYTRMYETGESRGELAMMVSALNKRAFVRAMMLQEAEEATADLNLAERLGREARDGRGLVEMATLRCAACLPAAQFDQAVSSLGTSIDVARELDLKDELAESAAHMAQTYTYMTRYEEAWPLAQEALDLAVRSGDLMKVTEVLVGAVALHHVREGDYASALDAAQRALEFSDKIGSMLYQGISHLTVAAIHLATGQYEAAITHGKASAELWGMLGPFGEFFLPTALGIVASASIAVSPDVYERTRAGHVELLAPREAMAGAWAWADLGFIALQLGDADRAEEMFERGLTIPTAFWLLERPRLQVGMALVRLVRSDAEAAGSLLGEARQYADERGMRHILPLVEFGEAQLAFSTGDPARALDRFAAAAAGAQRAGMLPVVWQAHAGAAQVLAMIGRIDDVERERAMALATIDQMAAQFGDESLRAAFVENTGKKVGVGQTGDPSRR